MRDFNHDWFPEYGDKPAQNSWYPCKDQDDYWKIILQARANDVHTTLYRIVSMRGADIAYDLSMAQARAKLMEGTRRRA